ncbi:MAG: baseplate multidomain protein megatron, partial [Tranquillimonas sp.]
GLAVSFSPFLVWEQRPGPAWPDPYGGEAGQPVLPWRGRITTSLAPGLPGSPDGTAAAEQEVAAFFGAAAAEDFAPGIDRVAYVGPEETSYRRFILHYAHLCALAGGVEAFCIGSELRGLTRIRGADGGFPAVDALRQLAADVRAILPQAKIGYAADWSDYFGYRPADGSGDVYFNLDPLWADDNVDFIGIDNYMPLSDWRDGHDHADAGAGSIYDLGYLRGNVAGGEGYDWYYHAPEAEAAQMRTPITDGAYDEPWVFRYKDLRGWWSNPHHERRGGLRQETPTPWIPRSKPFRFTEMGCAAVDKGTNQPNKFMDPKSSESALPKYSDGRRDDLIQRQYLRAMLSFWSDPANNPVSDLYGGAMVDVGRMHAWAWDARPYPQFPGAQDLWADGENWTRGHWLTGRAGARSLDSVVREICARSGVTETDTRALYGIVRGYALDETGGARAALQPLMLAHGFDAAERDGRLVFRSRTGRITQRLDEARLAASDEMESPVEAVRAPDAETAGRVRVSYIAEEGSFDIRTAEAAFPDERSFGAAQSDLPMVLTEPEARAIAERWLAEARVARDRVRFALPPSELHLGAGDVVELRDRLYRIDRVERASFQTCEGVRIEPRLHLPSDAAEGAARVSGYAAPVPVLPVFLDLPLIRGDEVPHAPRIAVAARPWPGSVAVYDAALDEGFQLNLLLNAPATLGVTETPLPRARPECWDRGPPLRVRLLSGALSSSTASLVLSGANMMAIGDGEDDIWEVFQFARANLVAPGRYDLSARLRGRRGSDAAMPDLWPAGSRVVLLDGAARQIDLTPEARGLARSYRIGPARRSYDDPVYVEARRAFAGVGLRPYAPVHLRAQAGASGLSVTWRRRTRSGGDDWSLREVPLGEAAERYLVRVLAGGGIVREVEVASPAWTYAAADQAADGIAAPYEIAVAQISDRVGPGAFGRITIDG